MNAVVKGYLKLARPANLPTAAADILTGVAIAGIFSVAPNASFFSSTLFYNVCLLVCSSVCLYAGGVIFNDVFDAALDAVERPERPIPSGLIPKRKATVYGSIVMLLGITLAFMVSYVSGLVSVVLTAAILLYDGYSKNNGFLGPVNMGICRGINLLFGISIIGSFPYWYLAFIPVVYISAITLISRGEVYGKNKGHIVFAAVLYSIVVLAVSVLSVFITEKALASLPFLVLFVYLVFTPLIKAYKENSPVNIKKAVKAGVISLVVLDAALAACFSQWWFGIVVLLLLPLSMYLSKLFAVT